jgi:hypothetical protein
MPRNNIASAPISAARTKTPKSFTGRLTNLRQDIAARQDTSGDKFSIELDGQTLDNRGIAGELIVRRAEKIKNRFRRRRASWALCGFDLFLRPSFNNTVEMIVRGKNSYAARVTDTAQGTIRSPGATGGLSRVARCPAQTRWGWLRSG